MEFVSSCCTLWKLQLNNSQKYRYRKLRGRVKAVACWGPQTGGSWEGHEGDISWVAEIRRGGAAVLLYFVENEFHSVSFHCQASSCFTEGWQLRNRGDLLLSLPLGLLGIWLVELAAGCRTWVAFHVIFTTFMKVIVKADCSHNSVNWPRSQLIKYRRSLTFLAQGTL